MAPGLATWSPAPERAPILRFARPGTAAGLPGAPGAPAVSAVGREEEEEQRMRSSHQGRHLSWPAQSGGDLWPALLCLDPLEPLEPVLHLLWSGQQDQREDL